MQRHDLRDAITQATFKYIHRSSSSSPVAVFCRTLFFKYNLDFILIKQEKLFFFVSLFSVIVRLFFRRRPRLLFLLFFQFLLSFCFFFNVVIFGCLVVFYFLNIYIYYAVSYCCHNRKLACTQVCTAIR